MTFIEKVTATIDIILKYRWIILIVVGVVLFSSVTINTCERIHDKNVDKKLQKSDKRISDLLVEREQSLAIIEKFKSDIQGLEGQKTVPRGEAAQAMLEAAQAKEILENEDKLLQENIERVNAPVDICERLIRSCETAKRLKLYPESKVCECTEASTNQ